MNISIQNLTKQYKNGHQALKGVSLDIGPGMFGLLGPNGAGKTTLMRMLVAVLAPTDGQIWVDGLDLHANRKRIRSMLGYLPQDFSVLPRLKTWEYLDYAAALSGFSSGKKRAEAVDEMLNRVSLFDVRERRATKLSGGMKRRLGIAQALIGNPQIIVVDEPTVGLDPEERLRFRNLLADISQKKDVIIVLSTHIVGDISSTCEDIALLSDGEIVFNAPPTELIDTAKGHCWQVSATAFELEKLKAEYSVISTVPVSGGYEVKIIGNELNGLTGTPTAPNLEDAYVYFMEVLESQNIERKE